MSVLIVCLCFSNVPCIGKLNQSSFAVSGGKHCAVHTYLYPKYSELFQELQTFWKLIL
jgi:hypothetical protein